ncbi:MAG: tripartite tricarboxylate transporter substrate binding protein [Burkholderiaceae bacterium]
MHPQRRRTLHAVTGLAAAAAVPGAARAQAFPSKPLRLVVPHAAGGNSDAFARILSQRLPERFGQPVVVENRPGAGGTIACAQIARSAPDGYQLVVADTGTHAIAPTLYGTRLQYHVSRDFSPVMIAAMFSTVLLVHPSVPAKTPQEFVALAKSQPGKLTYSSAGTGNGSHLALEMFRTAAGGLDMVHVPYKGGAPAIQALIAGEVQLTAVSINTSLPHIRSGRARPLGLASSKRNAALPDLPTFNESGIPFEAENWLALVGPPGLPADVVARLNADIGATLKSPETRERLAGLGLEVVASTPAQYAQVLERDVVVWGKAVRDSGAVAE